MLVPGVRDFLERHRELPMAVGSNAEPENIALFLDGAGLRALSRISRAIFTLRTRIIALATGRIGARAELLANVAQM